MSITKEQALALQYLDELYIPATKIKIVAGCSVEVPQPQIWYVNGKCKTWKRDTNRFSIPIKHGFYTYGYLTSENSHLFTLEKKVQL